MKIMKRAFAAVIVAVMLLTSALQTNFTGVNFDFCGLEQIANAESFNFSGGDGTKDNPYLVSTPEQLNKVREYMDSHFKQIADIDMSSVANWEPIGNADSCTGTTFTHELPSVSYEPFNGSYDGNSFKISNVTISDNKVSFSNDIYGLFAALGKCTIKNVHLVGINYTINKSTTDYVDLWKEYGASFGVYVGGISGRSTDDSLVTDCSCSGSINVINCNDAFVGGILGYGKATQCENSTKIYINANSSSRHETDSTVHCGGIVGTTPSVNAVISKCLNQGTITATAGDFLYVGGISGEYGKIENCVNCGDIEGNIIKNSSYSSFAGNCNSGGIVGATSSDYTKYCVNYGNVLSSVNSYTWSASSYAGGIAGYSGYYNSGKIFNCINICESIHSSKKDKDDQLIDADAGRIAGRSISISECYSIDSTKVNGSATSGTNITKNGENASKALLITKTPYKDFDFSTVWTLDENIGGAVLKGFFSERIDSDGDGLLDVWEKEGLDFDGDGKIDVDLPTMGANPNIPDIFVEVDWMVRPQEKILWWETQSSRNMAPSSNSMKLVYESFKKHGINLHIDVGPNSIDYVTGKKWGKLSGGNEIPYKELFDIKTSWENTILNNFPKERYSVFKHCLFINQFDGTTSGIANDIPGQFFIVANQDWVFNGGDISVGGTFMHELGHTLGLRHGGCDNEHYKPNYLSIMNYAFQTTGLIGTAGIDYSDYKLPDINESHINENFGIDPWGLTSGTGLGTTLFYRDNNQRNVSPISKVSIDFNNNGIIENDVSIDLNPDGNVYDQQISVLKGHMDWNGIIYNGGEVGKTNNFSNIYSNGLDFKYNSDTLKEKTLEESLKTSTLASMGSGYVKLVPSTLIDGIDGQSLEFEVGNLSSESTTYTVIIKCKALFNTFSETLTLLGSKEKVEKNIISIPIPKTCEEGQYTITCSIISDKKTSNFTFLKDVVILSNKDINSMKDSLIKENVFDEKELNKIETIINKYELATRSSNVKNVTVKDMFINYKKSATIKPTIKADDGAKYTVKYSSSNTKVATVDNNGKVYAAKKGSATNTCTVTDSNGNTVQDTCKVTVKYSFGQWLIKILLFGWIWY